MTAAPLNYPPVFPVDQPNWRSYGGEYQTVVFDGNFFDVQRSPTKFITLNAVSITASSALWTPATGKRFRFMGGLVSVSTSNNVTLQDGVSGSTIFILPATAANTAFYINPPGNGILSGTIANALAAIGGGTTPTISGTLWGTEE